MVTKAHRIAVTRFAGLAMAQQLMPASLVMPP